MTGRIKTIYVVATAKKPHVKETLEKFLPWLRRRVTVHDFTEGGLSLEKIRKEPGCALVFGGDGTMLVAARHFAPHGVPVFGINLGKFGFLTQTTTGEAFDALEKVLAGSYEIEERMMLNCTLQHNEEIRHESVALNDVVISRTALSRLLTIELRVDGKPVNTYRADGLIVSTPVGSTAHSLAASGPILSPELDAFVICPICPHTLSNRPIVISHNSDIELHPSDYSEEPALTVDGQIFLPLGKDDVVKVKRAERSLKLIKVSERTFFETLREKLGWSGQPNYAENKEK